MFKIIFLYYYSIVLKTLLFEIIGQQNYRKRRYLKVTTTIIARTSHLHFQLLFRKFFSEFIDDYVMQKNFSSLIRISL